MTKDYFRQAGFVLLCLALPVFAQEIIRTGFENTEANPFAMGALNGQNHWSVAGGSALITAESAYVRSGYQGLKIGVANQTLVIENTAFSGSVSGVSGIVYMDVWVKINALSGKYFTLNGFDLYGGSQKRTFVAEFNPSSGSTGNFQIYSGADKVVIGQYQIGAWSRISIKADFTRSVYQVIFNGGEATTVNFREDYTPTASGTRSAGIKEFHQLRINLGYNSAVGSVSAGIDDLYIGTDPIADVTFGNVVSHYTLTVEQPVIGDITVTPDQPEYPESTLVTATLALPGGYQNLGWKGDLSGTELVKTFYMLKNTTIGANVGINPDDPPPRFKVLVIQPEFGSISLSPEDSLFYQYTKVTATLNLPSGFLFVGWAGDLSGNELIKTFPVLGAMTIGAVVGPDTTPPTIYTISSATELKNRLKGGNLRAGDIVEVLDGSYDTGGGITIEAVGIAQKPIIIRAMNIGGAILRGTTSFTLRKTAYIQIEGFDFRSAVYTAIKLEAAQHTRITRNFFRLTETAGESGKWVYIGGVWNDPYAPSHHNRIDHNLFENKRQLGNFITIDGQQEPVFQVSQYDQIDHNHFRDIGPRAANEMEAIRVGVSTLSMSSGFTVIEYNLFEDCDGDPEIISIKSCDDTVRYNTFRHSQGTLCLRHGNRSVVNGNYFFGANKDSCGGIRIYGNDHRVYNNYFDGLTGTKWDAAMTLTNGDYDGESSGGLTEHWRIKRSTICFNTFVNCLANFEIGFTNNGSYKKPPKDVTVANNLVVGKTNELVKILTSPENMHWSGNIMFPESTATLGISVGADEIRIVNPQLMLAGELWRLGETSPAIDAALGDYPYVTEDIDGQPRNGLYDTGADEFSTMTPICCPLVAENVGPFSLEPQKAISEAKRLPVNFGSMTTYPNPFNDATWIKFMLPLATVVKVQVYDLKGTLVATLVDERLGAGRHELIWQADRVSAGIYLCLLSTKHFRSVRKMMLVK